MSRIKLFIKKIKIFLKDHLHLIFKSSAENHLRIQAIRKKIKSQKGNQIVGEVCNLQFESYSQLKRYQKKVRIVTYSFSSTFTSLIVALIVVQMFFGTGKSQGATFGWLQTDWSGGVDTVTTANHNFDRIGWTQFFSKDAGVDVSGGEVKIASTSNSAVTTTDADFNAGTKTQTYVSAGSVFAQKPDGGTCTANQNQECQTGWCSGGVCVNPWQSVSACRVGGGGTGNALLVYKFDTPVGSNVQWKTTSSSCIAPQCSGGVLVADNTVDFSAYPARNACKALGGRLASMAELNCIYLNRASYVGLSNGYIFSSDSSGTSVAVKNLITGDSNNLSVTAALSNHCVQGQ